MFGIKSSSNTSKSSQSFDINQISPELRTAYEKIMYHIQHQLFLDPDLNNRQRMFLLCQRGAIENEFLRYLYGYIYYLNISDDLRDSLFQHLNKFSRHLIPVDMYSGNNSHNNAHGDSDDEAYIDTLSDIDSNEDDTYDDLENTLLDEIEMQHDITVFNSARNNQEEHSKE